MPALTPRGYPYSIPTDPADIPQAIEDLALAIDADVDQVEPTIGRRPMFRVSGSAPIVFPLASAVESLVMTWDNIEANVEGALASISSDGRRLIPKMPSGFWWVQCTLRIPKAGTAALDTMGMSLQTAFGTMSRVNTHVQPTTSDGSQDLTLSTGTKDPFGIEYFEMIAHINRAGIASGTYTLTRRTLTALMMTEV